MNAITAEAGNFHFSLTQSPRYVDMDKCIACGACAEKCPAKTADAFNERISKRKAIYVPYPQAVPLKYSIDPGRCIWLKKGKCGVCEKICPTQAIRFDDTAKEISRDVGAVIMTAGLQAFDPSGLDNYQHGKLPNVVTSLAFERLLSAGGPTGGHVTRPSDGRAPKRIAWLQCVGSRDLNRCGNQYCSSVCCMYAIKEAVIAKEHLGPEFEPTIFFMDMRTHGKEFEKYYTRAKAQGVRFIRSRVHTITETAADGTLSLRYVTEEGALVDEQFDLAVLSVGMEPAESAVETAKKLGVALNPHRFVATDDLSPVSTSRPGIYVAGVLQGCKDIPQSVVEASAAACSAALHLTPGRREPHQLPGVREGAAPDTLQVHVAGEVEPARVVETADGPDPAAEGNTVAVGNPGTRPGHRHPQQAGDPVGFGAARQALRHHGNPGAAFVFRGAAIHDTGDLPWPGVEKPAHMVDGKARGGVGLHGEVAQGGEKDQREKRGRPAAAGQAACDRSTAAADNGEREALFAGPFRADGNSGNQGQGQRDHRPGIGRCGKKSGFQRCRHFTRLMAAPSAANFFSRAS